MIIEYQDAAIGLIRQFPLYLHPTGYILSKSTYVATVFWKFSSQYNSCNHTESLVAGSCHWKSGELDAA